MVNAKSNNSAPRITLLITSTFFLFQRSTYAPAIEPKRIAGMVKEITTPDTAVLDWVNL